MDYESAERKLDGLSRKDLTRFAAAMVRVAGVDSAARLVSDGPYSPSDRSPQLELYAVDVTALHTRIERLSLFATAAAQVLTAGGPLAEAFAAADVSGAWLDEWRACADACRSALDFDPPSGLAVTADFLADTRQLGVVLNEWSGGDALVDRDTLRDLALSTHEAALAAALASMTDPYTFARIVAVTNTASDICDDDTAWLRVIDALSGDATRTSDDVIRRRLELMPRFGRETLPLLRILAESAATRAERDRVAQCATLFVADDPAVVTIVAGMFAGAGDREEAHFWLGDGRTRHTEQPDWEKIEAAV